VIKSFCAAAQTHMAGLTEMRLVLTAASGAEGRLFHDFRGTLMRLNPAALPEPADQRLRSLTILMGQAEIAASAADAAEGRFASGHYCIFVRRIRYVPNSGSVT